MQFVSDGGTLSGVDIELVGTGYRLSLVKKRFGTGTVLLLPFFLHDIFQCLAKLPMLILSFTYCHAAVIAEYQ